MIFKRLYDEKLAQASYLVGCAKTGEACVVDPNRNVEQYLEAAAAERLRITCVTETHIHADFLSGSRELAERSGAQMFLSDEGPDEWKYAFGDQPNVTLVKDGDSIRIGNVRLDVLHTPGHTPEHISFVLTDEASSPLPLGAFTGDFIFVGDVGRPDLLERAAGYSGTMEAGARVLFQSLRKFVSTQPDTLMIWPAHGAGSPCGKSLGGVPFSVLGYEKSANWGLKLDDEKTFVDSVLGGQPEPPYYFKMMKKLNKLGPDLLNGQTAPPRLGVSQLKKLAAEKAVLVDLRTHDEFSAGFIPGSLALPLDKSFTIWAGWTLPYDQPIYLLASTPEEASQAARDLATIGIDHVGGWFGPEAFREADLAQESLRQISVSDVSDRLGSGEIEVLDVRGRTEYLEGHIPGASHTALGYLDQALGSLPTSKPLALQCYAGGRSVIAYSVLRRAGFQNLVNVCGGFSAYTEAGLPIETGEAVTVSR